VPARQRHTHGRVARARAEHPAHHRIFVARKVPVLVRPLFDVLESALLRKREVTVASLAGERTNLYPAICGLGETGSDTDDRLILSYTLHRLGKIRGAAFRALARLNGTAHVDLFCNALKDKVPQVSRQALRALADKTSYISGKKVWEIDRERPARIATENIYDRS
jgi:hypothetical protein